MTELSPDAQTVWNAYEELLENECVVTKTDMKALVAALRTAVGSDVYKANLNDELEVMFSEGWNSLRKKILTIADELEDQ